MPAAAGGNPGDARTGSAADGSIEAEEAGIRGQGSGIRRPKSKGAGNRDHKTGTRPERGGAQMTWESFYLVCFLVGLFLSAFTLVGGMGHFGGGHVHMPHLPPGAHLPHGAAGPNQAQGTGTVPWWNAFSIMIFLCWFGAAGYLLTRYGGFVAGVVVALAGICGLAGG